MLVLVYEKKKGDADWLLELNGYYYILGKISSALVHPLLALQGHLIVVSADSQDSKLC